MLQRRGSWCFLSSICPVIMMSNEKILLRTCYEYLQWSIYTSSVLWAPNFPIRPTEGVQFAFTVVLESSLETLTTNCFRLTSLNISTGFQLSPLALSVLFAFITSLQLIHDSSDHKTMLFGFTVERLQPSCTPVSQSVFECNLQGIWHALSFRNE